MNNVNFFGRVDSEPDLLGMPGRDVCQFWLAAKGHRGKYTLHVMVVAFQGLAVRYAEILSEGDWVAVHGHLRSEPWPNERLLYRHTVIARDLQRVDGGLLEEAE